VASPIRIKRRSGGAPGAPSSLLNAELAYNEVDDILYYGKGTGGGGGTATTVIPVGGPGGTVMLSGNQTVGGIKTFGSVPKTSGTPSANDDLTTVAWVNAAMAGAGAGTVTSIAVSVPAGLVVSGSPVTTSGTISITYDTGYQGYTSAEATKLSGIASGATANQSDAYLLSRGNHTGTQAISTVSGLQTALDAKIDITQIGASLGVAGLDGSGKVPTSQLPDAVLGGMNYQGGWNATTNSPTIPAAASGNKGWYYIVTTAGTTTVDGISEWAIGDWIVSDGAAWDKIDNTDQVVSVNGYTGIVVIDVADLASAGTMAYQSASAVAITGGTIDGVTLDGGTF